MRLPGSSRGIFLRGRLHHGSGSGETQPRVVYKLPWNPGSRMKRLQEVSLTRLSARAPANSLGVRFSLPYEAMQIIRSGSFLMRAEQNSKRLRAGLMPISSKTPTFGKQDIL